MRNVNTNSGISGIFFSAVWRAFACLGGARRLAKAAGGGYDLVVDDLVSL
jgi:hypothetical protein